MVQFTMFSRSRSELYDSTPQRPALDGMQVLARRPDRYGRPQFHFPEIMYFAGNAGITATPDIGCTVILACSDTRGACC